MARAIRITAERGTGTGVFITPTLALTCEHVVKGASHVRVRTSGGEDDFTVIDKDDKLDVALIARDIDGAEVAPESVLIARALGRGRRPRLGETFVELCTDDIETPRSLAIELRPAPVDSRRVQFVVAGSREGVHHGYSGGPVVEIQPGSRTPRLLGIVRARDEATLDALDKAGAGWFVPTERIADRFPAVAALVESPVERDPAWLQHWQPRSRGVATSRDEGFFFCGRHDAHERVVRHLEEGVGLLIVTGSRGCGKSAVLARAVALGCPRYLTWMSDAPGGSEGGYRIPKTPVDAAVLARGKTADAVTAEIADQVGLVVSGPDGLVAELTGEPRSIVIDAVDEAQDPDALMTKLVEPMVVAGTRVAIGALRPGIAAMRVPQQSEWVDLTADGYRDPEAIPTYVASRLRAAAGYDAQAAEIVARAVAERAGGLFLVAELVVRTLAQEPTIDPSVPGWDKQLPADLTEAFRGYLGRFGDSSSRMLALLHPLAHTRGQGLSAQGDLWLAAANRLRPDDLDPFGTDDLTDARRRARDYLVGGRRGDPIRLYHQGLAGAICTLAATDQLNQADEDVTPEALERERETAASAFVDALVEQLPDRDSPADAYTRADPYLMQHLPSHLADNGRIGEMLDRPGLLLTADRGELHAAFERGATTLDADQANAGVAIAYASLAPRTPGDRAAALCCALRRQGAAGLAERVREAFLTAQGGGAGLPYELIGGLPLPDSQYRGIIELAVVEDGGRTLVVGGGAAGGIWSWWLDGEPGPMDGTRGHGGFIGALEVVMEGGRPVILSAGVGLRSWHLDGELGPLDRTDAHNARIAAFVVVEEGGRPLVVTAAYDGAVRSWRLDGEPGPLDRAGAHDGGTVALAVVEEGGRPLVVTSGEDGAVRSWRLDGEPGPLDRAGAHDGRIRALATVEEGGRPLVVTGGGDGAIRSWRLDGEPGPLNRPDAHTGMINVLKVVDESGRPLVVSGDVFGTIRSWRLDGEPGQLNERVAGHGGLRTLKVLSEGGRQLVVTGSMQQGVIQSWWLDGEPGPLNQSHAHWVSIGALAVVQDGSRPLVLSSGGDDGVILAHSITPGTGGRVFRDSVDSPSDGTSAFELGRSNSPPSRARRR